jgi:hypothetical protein
MILLITQNTQVKIPKYPQMKSFFFVFFRLKLLFACTWKLKKPDCLYGREPKKHLSAHEIWEIESETTIIIHSEISLDLQWFTHTI